MSEATPIVKIGGDLRQKYKILETRCHVCHKKHSLLDCKTRFSKTICSCFGIDLSVNMEKYYDN